MPRIKNVIFDADGMVIDRHLRFSDRFSNDFGVPVGEMSGFFEGPFKKCRVGKADLRAELQPFLPLWKWEGSVDELVAYWLEGEGKPNKSFLKEIASLQKNGIFCYLATDNDAYRTKHLRYALALQEVFNDIFSSSDFGVTKGESAFWERVSASIGGRAKKKEILVWDDDEKNVTVAKTFGCCAELYTDFESYKSKMNELLQIRAGGVV